MAFRWLGVFAALAVTSSCDSGSISSSKPRVIAQSKAASSEAESTADKTQQIGPGLWSLPNEAQLPPCTADRAGILYFIVDQKVFKSCTNGVWGTVDIRGEKGEKGDAGAEGTNGIDGTDQFTAAWRQVWSENVRSTVYIRSTFRNMLLNCGGAMSGTGFVVGANLVATNGHVVPAAITDDLSCPNMVLTSVDVWFPTSIGGDTFHNQSPATARAVAVDRQIAVSDDIALVQVATTDRVPLTLSARDEAADKLTGDGVKLGEPVLLIGFSLGTTFAHFATGAVTALQAVNERLLSGFLAPGRLVYEFDLVSGGGSSGGPILDLRGQVIGVNFAEAAAQTGVEWGYAAQVKHLRNLLAGERVWTQINP